MSGEDYRYGLDAHFNGWPATYDQNTGSDIRYAPQPARSQDGQVSSVLLTSDDRRTTVADREEEYRNSTPSLRFYKSRNPTPSSSVGAVPTQVPVNVSTRRRSREEDKATEPLRYGTPPSETSVIPPHQVNARAGSKKQTNNRNRGSRLNNSAFITPHLADHSAGPRSREYAGEERPNSIAYHTGQLGHGNTGRPRSSTDPTQGSTTSSMPSNLNFAQEHVSHEGDHYYTNQVDTHSFRDIDTAPTYGPHLPVGYEVGQYQPEQHGYQQYQAQPPPEPQTLQQQQQYPQNHSYAQYGPHVYTDTDYTGTYQATYAPHPNRETGSSAPFSDNHHGYALHLERSLSGHQSALSAQIDHMSLHTQHAPQGSHNEDHRYTSQTLGDPTHGPPYKQIQHDSRHRYISNTMSEDTRHKSLMDRLTELSRQDQSLEATVHISWSIRDSSTGHRADLDLEDFSQTFEGIPSGNGIALQKSLWEYDEHRDPLYKYE
ncbi:uncharacterized protein I303_102318 [Kwoniella dejecticola CBS 10117]|uniref:Uncharacterized protein n=1 Tax=Kwoniella dejecticola CBS 10117 TaxID=1296121 RepID=A0A1A6ABA7_9TREE|nr:uncharacterized protein I303_01541 [Kwoniella dejecticola CBS 10117]OBR87339.1 hypothetical protein I303_01541 [Kwoniella dejecticola CBS 10117]